MGNKGLNFLSFPDAALLPKSDINLERVVLGCIVNDPTLAPSRISSVSVEDFSDENNAKIYHAILRAYREKGSADFASVGSYLIGNSTALQNLASCTGAVGIGSQFESSLQRLKEITAEKKSHRAAMDFLLALHEGRGNISDLISKLQQAQSHSISFEAYRCSSFFAESLPDVEPLLLCRNTGVLYPGDILSMQGQAKTCKTTLLMSLIATMTSGDSNLYFSVPKILKVLLIDSEQSAFNLHKQGLKARMLGADMSRIEVFAMRSVPDSSKILDYVIQAANAYRPNVIVIDNVKDLVSDFNNLAESSEAVRRLMKLAEDLSCGIIAVIHENIDTEKARGHIGSTLKEKVSAIIRTERTKEDSGCFRVTFPTVRNAPVDEFCFRLDSDVLPELVDTITPMNKSKSDQMDSLFAAIFSFNPSSPLAASEIKKHIVSIEQTSERTAERRIKVAHSSGVIFKVTGDDRYYLSHRLRPQDKTYLNSDDLPE